MSLATERRAKVPTLRGGIPVVLTCFLFLLNFSPLSAQVYFSTNPKYLASKSEGSNLLTGYAYNYPDTSLTWSDVYHPRNSLGNIGMASAPYFLKFGSPDLGFIFFRPPLADDRLDVSEIAYYQTRGPFARLAGAAGSKEMQVFKAFFTQSYKQKLNISLRFNRYTSTGFYKRQQTFTNNFYLSSNYATSSKRLGYYLFILNNVNRNNENGGLSKGRLTDTTYSLLKQTLPVRISRATRENRELMAMLNPYWRLNRTSDTSAKRFDQFIELKSSLHDQLFKYSDQDPVSNGFYKDVILDSTRTRDSTHSRQFNNGVYYVVKGVKGDNGLSLGYTNQITQFWQLSDSLFRSDLVSADFAWLEQFDADSMPARSLQWRSAISAQYVLSGTNQGDKKLALRSTLGRRTGGSELFLNALYEQRSPDLFYRRYVSNHFNWTNSFKKQEQTQLKLGARIMRSAELSVFVQQTSNYIYMDSTARPAQSARSVQNLGLSLSGRYVVFRHLGLALNGQYQQTNAEDIVLLPKTHFVARIFYTGSHFRNNLQIEFGPQLEMYGSFTPYAYMPATQTFYVQHRVQTAAYPFVDFYLNARLRPVNIFLKVENLLQGYAGPDYFLVPGYYQPDRAFRFGLSWMFFD